MKIETKFEIGDPVCVVESNQHDGYYIEYRGFRYSDIPNEGKTVFGTYKEASDVVNRENYKMFDKRK